MELENCKKNDNGRHSSKAERKYGFSAGYGLEIPFDCWWWRIPRNIIPEFKAGGLLQRT
jgi:hypothetical protein